jgi:hypothetical protein
MIILFWILAAYGMTSILVWGKIFDNQREWIKKHSKFFGDLISCTLCTSTWVGFFMSLVFGGLTNHYLPSPWYVCLFFDGMFTAGSVWALNAIIEFFEESRIK